MTSRQSVREIAKGVRHGLRGKLAVANFASRLLPEAASGWIRGRLYRWVGMDIHPSVYLLSNLSLPGGDHRFAERLHIGANSVLAVSVTINLHDEVRIGERVTIGPHVKIYTGLHSLGPGSQRCEPAARGKPVVIEDGAWLMLCAVVLPGVTIGRGSVVASGSVVTKDVPPNSYVEGNPAVVIRTLPLANR